MCRCGRSTEESDRARREETDRIILEFAKKHPELVRQPLDQYHWFTLDAVTAKDVND